MSPELRSNPVQYDIHAFSLRHDPAKSYAEEIMLLLGRLWPTLKSSQIAHDGINRVVYDRHPGQTGPCSVYAGVIVNDPSSAQLAESLGLERKSVRLSRYAYRTHRGPYRLLPQTCENMINALATQHALTISHPMVEVYSHWDEDESKLVTETFVQVA